MQKDFDSGEIELVAAYNEALTNFNVTTYGIDMAYKESQSAKEFWDTLNLIAPYYELIMSDVSTNGTV